MSEKLIREDSLKSYANTFWGINESDNIFLFLGCGNYFEKHKFKIWSTFNDEWMSWFT